MATDDKRIIIRIDVVEKNASVNINKTKKSVDGLASSTQKLAKATNNNRAQSGLNNAILIETGRVASDASFGIQGIANNIGRLTELFQEFSRTGAGGVRGAFVQLGKSLMGVGGLIVGFQLLLSFGPKIVKKFKEMRTAASELGGAFDGLGERASKTAGRFEIYIKTIQSSTKSDEEKKDAIEALNKEFPDYIRALDDAGVSLEDVANKTEGATKQNDLYRKSIVKLAMSQAAFDKIQEIQGKIIEIQTERNNKAQEEFGKTTEQLRKDIENYNSAQKENLAITGTTVGTLQDLNKEEKELLNFRRDEEEQLTRQINSLLPYIDIQKEEVKIKRKSNRLSEEKNKYDMLEVGNFNHLIDLIKEAGRMREFFFNKEMDIIISREENSQDAIEMERQGLLARADTLVELGLLEEDAAKLKFQINQYYNKLAAEDQERLDRQGFAMRMSMISAYADSLGSLSQIIGANTDVGKAAALTEIGLNTAVGFMNGLIIAQEQAKAAGPVAGLAFPLFYAQQIASVLAAASQAKSILQGGTPTGASRGAGGQTTQVEAPDFNVVGASSESQLAQSIGEQQTKPIKAFVVGKEVTTQQELDRNTINTAGLGG